MATNQFSDYPVAGSADYADGTTFLIQNEDGETKLADLENLKSTFFCETLCTTVTITSAEVLALNSSPLEIIAAQGAGTAIQVIGAVLKVDFNSAAYASATTPYLGTLTSYDDGMQFNAFLAALSTTMAYGAFVDAAPSAGADIIENESIVLGTAAAAPTGGDSDLQIWVYYRIIAV